MRPARRLRARRPRPPSPGIREPLPAHSQRDLASSLGTATSRRGSPQARQGVRTQLHVPSVHQGYIEPHTCVVAVGADGIVDIWAANKGPHIARAQHGGGDRGAGRPGPRSIPSISAAISAAKAR